MLLWDLQLEYLRAPTPRDVALSIKFLLKFIMLLTELKRGYLNKAALKASEAPETLEHHL